MRAAWSSRWPPDGRHSRGRHPQLHARWGPPARGGRRQRRWRPAPLPVPHHGRHAGGAPPGHGRRARGRPAEQPGRLQHRDHTRTTSPGSSVRPSRAACKASRPTSRAAADRGAGCGRRRRTVLDGRTGQGPVGHVRRYGTSLRGGSGMVGRISAAAERAGVQARFDLARPANTFDAHRLLHLAKERGVQDRLASRLTRAYLAEGELLSDHATRYLRRTDAAHRRAARHPGCAEPAVDARDTPSGVVAAGRVIGLSKHEGLSTTRSSWSACRSGTDRRPCAAARSSSGMAPTCRPGRRR